MFRILKKHKFKPYKIHITQTLHLGDNARRIELCQWLLQKIRDQDFLSKIIWTDESKFTNCGIFNRHNEHFWAIENPREFRAVRPQVRFGVNVWIGLVGDTLLGPYIFEDNLTAQHYAEFLRTTLLDYLENIPLARLRDLWWQQDGAPPHNAREVTNILNEMFPNKWLGTNGPVRWAARSPDISPLDYFLWGYLKNEIYKTPVQNAEGLRNKIITACRQINRRSIVRAIQRLPRRLQLCIGQNGAQFEHLL